MNKIDIMTIDWLLLSHQRYSNYENGVESFHEDSENSTHRNNLDENNLLLNLADVADYCIHYNKHH